MTIKNVIQLGASGSVGVPVLNALIASGRFNVTALTRDSSKNTFPPGVTVVEADYSSHESLVKALKGQDAAVVTLGGTANLELLAQIQRGVIAAAIEAGVSHIIPSSFVTDLSTDTATVYVPKVRLEQYLTTLGSEGKINFTAINTGAWFDWGLVSTFIGIDLVNKKAVLIDNGERKIAHTNVASVGDAVVSILSNPELIKNRGALIHDFFVSQREILQIAEEELGTKFEIIHVDSEELRRRSEPGLATWDPASVGGAVQANAWGPNSSCMWEVDDDSKALGITQKDLREEIVKVIKQLKLRD